MSWKFLSGESGSRRVADLGRKDKLAYRLLLQQIFFPPFACSFCSIKHGYFSERCQISSSEVWKRAAGQRPCSSSGWILEAYLRHFFNFYVKYHSTCSYLSESPETESLHVLGQDFLKIDQRYTWCAEHWELHSLSFLSCLGHPERPSGLWEQGRTKMGECRVLCLSEPGISFLWDDVSDLVLFQPICVHFISFILMMHSSCCWCF